jgi:hypothetical protein
VLAPGGTCAASFFLLNDERRQEVEAGRSFMPFPFPIRRHCGSRTCAGAAGGTGARTIRT